MGEVFITANPPLHAGRVRSVRLHGVAISIRLEKLFRDVPSVDGPLLRFA